MACQQVLTQADEFQKIKMGGCGRTGVLHQYLVLLISVASGFHLVGSMTDQNWIWVTWDWRMGGQFTMKKLIRCTEKCCCTHLKPAFSIQPTSTSKASSTITTASPSRTRASTKKALPPKL